VAPDKTHNRDSSIASFLILYPMSFPRINPNFGTQFTHSYKILPSSPDMEGTGMSKLRNLTNKTIIL
jgi:hypothetical protein